MVLVDRTSIGLIIIPQNSREEIRLTLQQRNGLSFVDLRMYALDQEDSKAYNGNGILINVKLWPQFRSAAFSLETRVGLMSIRHQKITHSHGVGQPIFPSSIAFRKYHQEQIYLEQNDFRGIPFITFKALIPSKRGRPQPPQRLITIGPVLWSQLIKALNVMEELLISLGFFSE